jgi:tetratricopeptide (TPR) repeat protein
MSKNKKNPVNTVPLSPEKYVRTQARTLPVEECLVTAGWQSNGICNVIIARRHKTGNFTVGIYLVDLYCLGLKDTDYHFNISPAEYSHLKNGGPASEKCSYALAHNMVFGSIAFAEDYGFKPHKAFAATRFILEEDTEDVELIDIEFGLDGQPFFMRGPYDDDARANSILATLEQTAGPGNYNFVDGPEYFGTDDDDFLDDDAFGDDYDPLLDVFNRVSEKYDEFIRPADAREALNNSAIGRGYDLTGEPIQSEYVWFDSAQEEADYLGFHQMVFDGEKLDRAIGGLRQAILKYPGKPIFYNLLQSAYLVNGDVVKSDEITVVMNQLFPDYLFSKMGYANFLLYNNRPEEAIAVFNGKHDLNQLYPHRKLFHKSEASAFWGTMCRCYTAMGDADRADEYMNEILKQDLQYSDNQNVVQSAVTGLCKLKLHRLKEKETMDAA